MGVRYDDTNRKIIVLFSEMLMVVWELENETINVGANVNIATLMKKPEYFSIARTHYLSFNHSGLL